MFAFCSLSKKVFPQAAQSQANCAQLPDVVLGMIRDQAQAIVGMLERVRVLRQHKKAA
jgi:hypothetical protein